MKRLKMITSVISAAVLTAVMGTSVTFAENMSKLSDKEMSLVSTVAEQEKNWDISGYDIEKAYKMYILKNNLITEYKADQNFESLITDESRIILPADGKLLTLVEENNGYKIIGEKYSDENFNFDEIVQNAVNNLDEEVVNIIHTYSYRYYMDIIYVETEQNEYVLPYFNMSYDLDGDIISGKVYTVNDFMSRMDSSFDESYAILHGDENGCEILEKYGTGDVNLDNAVDLYDAILICKHLLGSSALSEFQIKIADVNGNGRCDLHDVIQIAKSLLYENS